MYTEDEIVSPTVIIGCTDVLALNYNPNATVDNGFCTYTTIISGCMDTIATNYNATATSYDGADYDKDIIFTGYHNRDENGFTSNNINQRKGNTSFIHKRKLINSIKVISNK